MGAIDLICLKKILSWGKRILKKRVLIVDDHKMFRDGLKMVINHEADMEVVGEAENGQRAVESASELQPDVILMDVKMPVMDGIEATRQIHAKMPGIKILALSMYSDNSIISGIMRAGAVGYIIKGDDSQEMYKVIRRVAVSENS
jgi:two-component system response regulator NreC